MNYLARGDTHSFCCCWVDSVAVFRDFMLFLLFKTLHYLRVRVAPITEFLLIPFSHSLFFSYLSFSTLPLPLYLRERLYLHLSHSLCLTLSLCLSHTHTLSLSLRPCHFPSLSLFTLSLTLSLSFFITLSLIPLIFLWEIRLGSSLNDKTLGMSLIWELNNRRRLIWFIVIKIFFTFSHYSNIIKLFWRFKWLHSPSMFCLNFLDRVNC